MKIVLLIEVIYLLIMIALAYVGLNLTYKFVKTNWLRLLISIIGGLVLIGVYGLILHLGHKWLLDKILIENKQLVAVNYITPLELMSPLFSYIYFLYISFLIFISNNLQDDLTKKNYLSDSAIILLCIWLFSYYQMDGTVYIILLILIFVQRIIVSFANISQLIKNAVMYIIAGWITKTIVVYLLFGILVYHNTSGLSSTSVLYTQGWVIIVLLFILLFINYVFPGTNDRKHNIIAKSILLTGYVIVILFYRNNYTIDSIYNGTVINKNPSRYENGTLIVEGYHLNDLTFFSDVDQVQNITKLELDSNGLTSLQGIEAFTNLNSLTIKNNELQTIDGVDFSGISKISILENPPLTISNSNFAGVEKLYIEVNDTDFKLDTSEFENVPDVYIDGQILDFSEEAKATIHYKNVTMPLNEFNNLYNSEDNIIFDDITVALNGMQKFNLLSVDFVITPTDTGYNIAVTNNSDEHYYISADINRVLLGQTTYFYNLKPYETANADVPGDLLKIYISEKENSVNAIWSTDEES